MLERNEIITLIIDKLGLRDLSTAEQGEIIRRLEANIASRINIAIIERLPEAEHAELLRVSEGGDQAAIEAFLNPRLPDLDQLIKQVATEAVAEFKALSSK